MAGRRRSSDAIAAPLEDVPRLRRADGLFVMDARLCAMEMPGMTGQAASSAGANRPQPVESARARSSSE